jgi:hypothetical protein
MTTEEKLKEIVDKLLVKTQDDLCKWKKVTDFRFKLTVPGFADIIIVNMGNDNIVMEIFRGDIEIATLRADKKDEGNSLVRLYGYVKMYQEKYVKEQIEKLMAEIENIGKTDLPF